jgi:hypothetical protein
MKKIVPGITGRINPTYPIPTKSKPARKCNGLAQPVSVVTGFAISQACLKMVSNDFPEVMIIRKIDVSCPFSHDQ